MSSKFGVASESSAAGAGSSTPSGTVSWSSASVGTLGSLKSAKSDGGGAAFGASGAGFGASDEGDEVGGAALGFGPPKAKANGLGEGGTGSGGGGAGLGFGPPKEKAAKGEGGAGAGEGAAGSGIFLPNENGDAFGGGGGGGGGGWGGLPNFGNEKAGGEGAVFVAFATFVALAAFDVLVAALDAFAAVALLGAALFGFKKSNGDEGGGGSGSTFFTGFFSELRYDQRGARASPGGNGADMQRAARCQAQ